ncbi:MAG: cytochrome C oxidase subunit IV family protein [Planctomycetota bacterium]
MSQHNEAAHGHDEEHHHVSSMFTLSFVLLILLALTVLTFALGFVEAWIAQTWSWTIPTWLNVAVVMSIATVKAVLVLAYFMHLRHDNALNTLFFVACLFAFALFIGLTMLDLGTRGRVYPYKAELINAGGNSVGLTDSVEVERDGETEKLQIVTNEALFDWVKNPEVAEARLGEKMYEKVLGKAHHHAEQASSAQMSRPATGVTAGLFDAVAPAEHHGADHGAGHNDHDDGEHGDDGHGDDGSH